MTFALATCSYRALRPEMGVGVATSVGKPRGWQGNKAQGIPSKPTLNLIAPFGIFGHKPEYDEPTFRRLYRERLDGKAQLIDAALAALAGEHPGERLVLLCWCTVSHDDGYCHRRMFARWAERRYGVEVPELTLDAPLALGPGRPRKRCPLGRNFLTGPLWGSIQGYGDVSWRTHSGALWLNRPTL